MGEFPRDYLNCVSDKWSKIRNMQHPPPLSHHIRVRSRGSAGVLVTFACAIEPGKDLLRCVRDDRGEQHGRRPHGIESHMEHGAQPRGGLGALGRAGSEGPGLVGRKERVALPRNVHRGVNPAPKVKGLVRDFDGGRSRCALRDQRRPAFEVIEQDRALRASAAGYVFFLNFF
jgi:hypothetical protein